MSGTLGPGDLAVIVRSWNQANVGIIVQVDRWIGVGESVKLSSGRVIRNGNTAVSKPKLLIWSKGRMIVCRHTIRGVKTGRLKRVEEVYDSPAAIYHPCLLRKLDFDTGQDEILRIAGLPKDQPAKLAAQLVPALPNF